jgi:hypothetical protein
VLSAAVLGPSQFFTLDAACWYGCQATGAGNCEEICQTPAYSVTGTGTPSGTGSTSGTPTKSASSNLQWWILGACAVVALVVVAQ